MTAIKLNVRDKRTLARRKRIPPAIRAEVVRAFKLNTQELGAAVGRVGAFNSKRIGASVRRGVVPGSLGLAQFVRSGGRSRGVYFAHFVDGGTKAGFRRYKRPSRNGKTGFYHPGTRATGYHRGTYRQLRSRLRARTKRAYRKGAKTV